MRWPRLFSWDPHLSCWTPLPMWLQASNILLDKVHVAGGFQASFIHLSPGCGDSSSHWLIIKAGGWFCNVYEEFIAWTLLLGLPGGRREHAGRSCPRLPLGLYWIVLGLLWVLLMGLNNKETETSFIFISLPVLIIYSILVPFFQCSLFYTYQDRWIWKISVSQ